MDLNANDEILPSAGQMTGGGSSQEKDDGASSPEVEVVAGGVVGDEEKLPLELETIVDSASPSTSGAQVSLVVGNGGSTSVEQIDLTDDERATPQVQKWTPPSLAFAENMKSLADMGFGDVKQNRKVLQECKNHVWEAIEVLLRGDGQPVVVKESASPPSKKARMGSSSSANPVIECGICLASFPADEEYWKELKCHHEFCNDCYKKLEKKEESVSKKECLSISCPFCRTVTGEQIGNVPDGTMEVRLIPDSVAGYPGIQTYEIHYKIYYDDNILHRKAYLPDVEEGREALKRLETAWDRRITFVYGNSKTTRERNVLIWNIPQKSAFAGGPEKHGYPDPEYFDHLKYAVAEYGIE